MVYENLLGGKQSAIVIYYHNLGERGKVRRYLLKCLLGSVVETLFTYPNRHICSVLH